MTTTGLTSHYAKFVIPGAQTFNVRYVVDLYLVKNNTETLIKTETKTAENIEATFEKNHVYNIKGTLGLNKPIQFTVNSMTSWEDAPKAEVEM